MGGKQCTAMELKTTGEHLVVKTRDQRISISIFERPKMFAKNFYQRELTSTFGSFPVFFFLRVIDGLSDHNCSITANCPITPVQSN